MVRQRPARCHGGDDGGPARLHLDLRGVDRCGSLVVDSLGFLRVGQAVGGVGKAHRTDQRLHRARLGGLAGHQRDPEVDLGCGDLHALWHRILRHGWMGPGLQLDRTRGLAWPWFAALPLPGPRDAVRGLRLHLPLLPFWSPEPTGRADVAPLARRGLEACDGHGLRRHPGRGVPQDPHGCVEEDEHLERRHGLAPPRQL
mmetsp:Transcript_53543/g.171592  ORF Transcript_53543/g.171592 Transcript_53543/m.171592 type:complete len:200 (-) Transcript_53543:87-686(-)